MRIANIVPSLQPDEYIIRDYLINFFNNWCRDYFALSVTNIQNIIHCSFAGVMQSLHSTQAKNEGHKPLTSVSIVAGNQRQNILLTYQPIPTSVKSEAIADSSNKFLRLDSCGFRLQMGSIGPPRIPKYIPHLNTFSTNSGVIEIGLAPVMLLPSRILAKLGLCQYIIFSHPAAQIKFNLSLSK